MPKQRGGRHSRVFPRGARQGNGMKLQARVADEQKKKMKKKKKEEEVDEG